MTTKLFRLSAAALFLAASFSMRAAIAPAENLLPADTIAFFTVPDCNGLRAASKVSPQLMFWNDPAMKAFREKFMAKLTEQYIAPLEKDLGLKVEDFADLPQGQFTLAATVNGANGHDDTPPGLVLLLDAKDKSAQLKTNLTALVKKMTDNGRTLRTEKIRGLAFTVVTLSSNDLAGIFGARTPVSEIGKEQKPEKPVDIYFTQYESLLVAANSAKLADAIAAHLTGGSAPALADDATFAADKLSQFRSSPTYYGWFNGKVFFNLLAQLPEDTSGGNGMMPSFSATKLIAATGLGNLKSASFALNEAREGSTGIFHFNAPADTRSGLLKMLALPARAAAAPDFVPADVIKFSRFRLDGKQAWADLQKLLANLQPQALAMLNSAVDMANSGAQQKEPGFDLRNDLFGNLGDDIITWTKPPVGDSIKALSNPPGIALIATPNPEKMIHAIQILGALAAPQESAAPREFHGHKIHAIAMRPARGPGGTSVPQPPLLLSSAAGYLAFTTDPGALEEFLRRTEAPGKSLRENAALTEAAAHIGGTGKGMFTYQNQRETMRMTFKLFKNAAGSDPALNLVPANIREWADFSLLPEYEKVSKYFYLSVVGGGGNSEGLDVKVFTPRPPTLN